MGTLVPDRPPNGVAGIEREYAVLQGSETLDFRTLIRELGLEGGGLDPSDPNAHHLASGTLVTADGAEAEVATPPAAVEPGCTTVLAGWSARGERAVADALPDGVRLDGYSTHLNVEVSGDVVAVAERFARHFALGMMLLLDRRDSPGLLVRPRPARLELGGEFATGWQLRAATAYAIAAARACGGGARVDLPPAPHVDLERARERQGWFVSRHGFGPDLYVEGRAAEIRLRTGQESTAGESLAVAWRLARDAAIGVLGEDELALVDDAVEGARPLPIEAVAEDDVPDGARMPESPFGRLDVPGATGGRLTVAAVTWEAVAFAVEPDARAEQSSRRTFVTVPRAWLSSFLDAVTTRDLHAVVDEIAESQRTEADGPTVAARLDRKALVPVEPSLPGPWWQRRWPELAGAAAGVVAAAGAIRWWTG